MRLGAFDINEPVPELNEPHALAVIPSWLDVGGVGNLILSHLEAYLGSKELARLAIPGSFFDFTRYRPILRQKDNHSEVEIPNAFITFGKKLKSRDYIFLRLPEPHMMAEVYVDSVVELLKTFNVKRYCLFGSIYDMVPYTRPLLVTGSASNVDIQNKLNAEKVISSNYQGSSSILHLVEEKAFQLGMETLSLIVHLPNYLPMSEDYRGVRRLMEIICSLYDFIVPQEDIEKAKEQDEQVRIAAENFIEHEPHLRLILKQLEDKYDSQMQKDKEEIHLTPEVEKFLQELSRRFDQN